MNKKNLYRWHKNLGMTLGLILFILGLSGASIVYRDELLPVIYPDVFLVEPQATRRPVEEIILATRAHLGSENFTHLYTSERDDTATMIFTRPEGSLLPHLITLNPYTATVKGEMPLIKNVFGLMLFVHANLLLGKIGSYIVGLMGLIMTGFVVSGVILLWGPHMMDKIKKLPLLGTRGLHRGMGLAFAAPLVFVGMTGFILSFDILGDGRKPKDLVSTGTCNLEEQLSSLKLLSPLQKTNIVSIHFCSKKNALMKISSGIHERDGHDGFRKVLIDPKLQKIVQEFDSEKDPAAWNRNALTIYPLHTGSYFGEIGRFVILISGIALIGLYLSGVLVSLRLRCKKKASANSGLALKTTGEDLV